MWNPPDPTPPEPKPEEIYPPCDKCDGTGIWAEAAAGRIVIFCDHCDGLGYIVPEEDEEIPY